MRRSHIVLIALCLGVALALVIILGVALTFLGASGGGSEQSGPTTAATTVAPAGEPTTFAPQPGQHWGGFLFCDQPMPCILPPDQLTPPPRPLKGDEGHSLVNGHPGYRQFNTIDDLARFIDGRAVLRVPQFLPPNGEALGGYAVVGDEGRIFVVDISYGLGDSDASVNDPDLSIGYNLYTPRPSVYHNAAEQSGPGRGIGAPRLLTIRGHGAVYREAMNPPGLTRGQMSRSSLNWFEEDGSAWAVQARGLDLATIVAIAESLADY